MVNPYVPEFVQRIADSADANPVWALGVTLLLCFVSFFVIQLIPAPKAEAEPEPEPPTPRNFTHGQLLSHRSEEDGIYMGVKGEVFDVTQAADFYAPGNAYHALTGREASRALAKVVLEGPDLDNTRLDDLSYGEKERLDEWYQMFKYHKCYPVVGRVVTPPAPKRFTEEELRKYTGTQEVPTGYGAAPLYIAVRGNVYDVSFGGLTEMYLPGGPYANLAGRDGNRALGKMSLKEEDMFSRDISDFTPKENKVLDDWAKKFEGRYPCVGTLRD